MESKLFLTKETVMEMFKTNTQRIAVFVCGVMLTMLAGTSANATVLTTTSTADTMVTPGDTGGFDAKNWGTNQQMFIGSAGIGSTAGISDTRALVAFSLAGIPTGQVITSATLSFQNASGAATLFTLGGTADLYRVLVPWVEGDGGTTVGTTGATWFSRDKGGSLANWTGAGASGAGTDRAATATATATSANLLVNILSLDVLSDVQSFYSGATTNYGWLLQVTTYDVAQFYAPNPKDNTNLQLPTLVINYEAASVPEPASLALLGVGGLMMLRRRRAC